MSFQNNLRELRLAKGLTQQQLGEVFHVSRTTISNYETGKIEPSIKLILDISEYFEVSLDQLLK
jgi:transcriptional regulator with XRE-family HTH domain